jgi:uncharacterized protein YidB (DUF937 family)
MGFLDALRGMQNGPGGAAVPSGSGTGSGMSPVTMALLALLAFKAWKGHSARADTTNSQMAPANPQAGSGGFGDLLGGIFGGRGGTTSAPGGLGGWLSSAVAGGSLGGVLGDGLRKLLGDMQANGNTDHAQSWVGTGPNLAINESDLAKAIGADDIEKLSQQTGMSRGQLLSELHTQLPAVVDELTPNGRMPTREETSQWI